LRGRVSGGGDDIFRRDQFDLIALAPKLLFDRAENFGIAAFQGFSEKSVVAVRCIHG
jgi:hypothetical protein